MKARVTVMLKSGVLDVQGEAVRQPEMLKINHRDLKKLPAEQGGQDRFRQRRSGQRRPDADAAGRDLHERILNRDRGGARPTAPLGPDIAGDRQEIGPGQSAAAGPAAGSPADHIFVRGPSDADQAEEAAPLDPSDHGGEREQHEQGPHGGGHEQPPGQGRVGRRWAPWRRATLPRTSPTPTSPTRAPTSGAPLQGQGAPKPAAART